MMTVLSVLSDDDVRAIAHEVFARSSEPDRRPELIIEAKPNFEGEDAIYVTAVYPDDVRRPDARLRGDIRLEFGRMLLDRGDARFVYLSTLSRSGQAELKSLEAEYPPDA